MAKVNPDKKLEKTIKVGTFLIAVVGAVTAFITWGSGFFKQTPTPDPLKEQRIEMYMNMSNLIGKLINEKNPDSLKVLSGEFYQFYGGKMILVEDSAVSLAMRKFKLELDDKMNGVENLLNPFKYEAAGMDVTKACQKHIEEMASKTQ